MEQKGKEPADMLRSAGLRATEQRLAIFRKLSQEKYPLSVKRIAASLGKGADQATTYRILEQFAHAGLATRSDFGHGHAHYELADTHDHHHVVCTGCGRIEDFKGCGYDEIAPRALKQAKQFARIDSHALELFGTCTSCAN